jgi:hypothetical protein
MNKQARQVLETGAVFGIAVVILDLLFTPIPALDWLGLGAVFFFVATINLAIAGQGIRRPSTGVMSFTTWLGSRQQTENEFDRLANIIDAGINKRDATAMRTLSERLRSLAIATVAARTGASQKEVLNILETEPGTLRKNLQDEQLLRLLFDAKQFTEHLTEEELQSVLSKIG